MQTTDLGAANLQALAMERLVCVLAAVMIGGIFQLIFRQRYQAQLSNQVSQALVESGEAIRRMAMTPGTYKEVWKYY
jgi:hypothetical protein